MEIDKSLMTRLLIFRINFRMSTRLIRTKSNPIAIESTYRNGERLWEQY